MIAFPNLKGEGNSPSLSHVQERLKSLQELRYCTLLEWFCAIKRIPTELSSDLLDQIQLLKNALFEIDELISFLTPRVCVADPIDPGEFRGGLDLFDSDKN